MTNMDQLREIQHRVMFEDLYNRMESAELKVGNLDELVKDTRILTFAGSATHKKLAEIMATANVGDVYNLLDDGELGKVGENVVWTGEEWDAFGSTIDLSGYATEQYVTESISDMNTQKIYVSRDNPSGGKNGDIWIKYTP